MAFKLKSPFNAYMDDADTSKLKQAQHSSSYTGPKNMITADGVNTKLTQDDKITTVGGDDPFSGYSKDSFKKKNGDDTPVPTDAEMKNTFDQFLFDNKEELDKLEQDIQNRKKPLYPSEKVEKRRTTSMRNPKDQLVDVDKYRKQKEEEEKALKLQDDSIAKNFSPKSPFMKKKQLTKTGAGKAHNMSALQYNQEQLMSSLSGANDQPSQADLDAMKALLSMQNSEGMSSSPMNQNGGPGDLKQGTKVNKDSIYNAIKNSGDKFQKAELFNKYAMQKGISPNFDSIRKADGYEAESDAMTKFYKNPANVKMMNREQKKFYSNKDEGSPMNQNGDPPKKIKRIKPVGQNVGEGGSQGFINAFEGSNQNIGKSLARGTRAEVEKNKKKIKRATKKGSPAKNDVRKMKRAAKKEDKAKMKAKRKEGTLDSSDFANQPYRTLKGKF
tara:strand:+ start:81 stop:1406 length:1326 start_codon:yes stop_codon:yes gene_type:complete